MNPDQSGRLLLHCRHRNNCGHSRAKWHIRRKGRVWMMGPTISKHFPFKDDNNALKAQTLIHPNGFFWLYRIGHWQSEPKLRFLNHTSRQMVDGICLNYCNVFLLLRLFCVNCPFVFSCYWNSGLFADNFPCAFLCQIDVEIEENAALPFPRCNYLRLLLLFFIFSHCVFRWRLLLHPTRKCAN